MNRLGSFLFLFLAMTAMCFVGSSSARADFQYTINVPNAALTPYTGPYGTVTVHDIDATHATITLQSAPFSGTNNFTFGDGSTLSINVNGSASILNGAAGITMTQPVAANFSGAGPVDSINSGNVSTFGNFNMSINLHDGANSSVNSMTFELVGSGTNWNANGSNVLTGNDNNFAVAGHVYVWNQDFTQQPTTGFAGDTGGGDVVPTDAALPAPSTWMLAMSGVGIFGLIGGIRLLRRKAALVPAVS